MMQSASDTELDKTDQPVIRQPTCLSTKRGRAVQTIATAWGTKQAPWKHKSISAVGQRPETTFCNLSSHNGGPERSITVED